MNDFSIIIRSLVAHNMQQYMKMLVYEWCRSWDTIAYIMLPEAHICQSHIGELVFGYMTNTLREQKYM